jgi:TRAP-type C4-dicarboxylate transport system permease small subunit
MLALLGAVVIGVVARQLNHPVAWSDEMAQHLLVWTGFVGLMIASRRRAHIRICAIADRLPWPIRRPLEVVIQLAVIGFALALLWFGAPLVPRNWDIEWVSLPLSSALLYLPIPFAAVAVAAQAVAEILHPGGSAAAADVT